MKEQGKPKIHVMIVEDEKSAKEIMVRYMLSKGAVTYAAVIDAYLRGRVVDALDDLA